MRVKISLYNLSGYRLTNLISNYLYCCHCVENREETTQDEDEDYDDGSDSVVYTQVTVKSKQSNRTRICFLCLLAFVESVDSLLQSF